MINQLDSTWYNTNRFLRATSSLWWPWWPSTPFLSPTLTFTKCPLVGTIVFGYSMYFRGWSTKNPKNLLGKKNFTPDLSLKDKSGGGQKMMSHLSDPKSLQICPIELAVAPETGGRAALEAKLLIRALGGPHELPGAPKGPPRGPKWPKIIITVKKLKKHNRINNQGPFWTPPDSPHVIPEIIPGS